MRTLDDRELGTVLAALRHYQRHLETNGGMPPREVEDIATNVGDFDFLDAEEIDSLCERLNVDEKGTDAPNEDEVLRTHVSGLLSALDTLGFAQEDKQVNGADVVNMLNAHLPGLRELVT